MPGINFFIHDLNPYGGQDRSTLEILTELSQHVPVHVYAFSFENPGRVAPNIIFHRCPFSVRRPVLVKSFVFQVWSLWVRWYEERRLTFATGTCSLNADIVHVQFIAQAWKQESAKVAVQRSWPRRQYHKILSKYNEFMERILFTERRSYVAISHSVASDLRSNFSAQKIRVIHHGVASGQFRPAVDGVEKAHIRRVLGIKEKIPVFLFVGAFDRKGLGTLVRAARALRTEGLDFQVAAVGAGDADAYRRLAGDEAGQWLRVFPPSKSVENFFRAADYFVFPTLYEPFGLVILEAMSAGLCVVASRLAGASELIRHGENGILVDNPSSADELEIALRHLLERGQVYAESLGHAARATAEARPWKKVAQEFRDWIDGQGASL